MGNFKKAAAWFFISRLIMTAIAQKYDFDLSTYQITQLPNLLNLG
jgi:hypothetical protein